MNVCHVTNYSTVIRKFLDLFIYDSNIFFYFYINEFYIEFE